MTKVLEQIVGLIETRLQELRDEEAHLNRVLQAIQSEDSIKEDSQRSSENLPKIRSKGRSKSKRGKQTRKSPRKTVADMIEETMLEQPQMAWTSGAIASRIGKKSKHVNGILAKYEKFMFIGMADDGLSKLYMLKAEFEALPDEMERYQIPSIQGTAERPAKNGEEKPEIVHSSAEGINPIPVG